MPTRVCNICHADYDAWHKPPYHGEPCPHLQGRVYAGKLCVALIALPCSLALPFIHEQASLESPR